MKKKVLSLLALLITVSACSNMKTEITNNINEPTPIIPAKQEPIVLTQADYKTASESGIVQANNKFGFKIFSQLNNQEQNKNLFIAPASLSTALTMTYNGADGATKEGMEKTLELSGLKIADVNQGYNKLLKILSYADDKVKFNIANSLWVNKGSSLKDSFVKDNEKNFDAKLSELDFSLPESLNTINNWVSDKTEKRIPKVLSKIEPDTILFLINAIYFKGSWSQKFDKEQTSDQDFNLSDGTKKTLPMMFRKSDYNYYKGDNFQSVELPYGDGKFSMYVFLPDETSNLNEFYKNLNQENWTTWTAGLKKSAGKVSIPRFKVEYEKELKDTLKTLGMNIAFSGAANFKNMIERSVSISQVIHKTFVEVNEEGTEAAGATVVAITKNSIAFNPKEFDFNANRPFFNAIVEKQTGTILFMGSINDPKAP